jgi:hypothetical protein
MPSVRSIFASGSGRKTEEMVLLTRSMAPWVAGIRRSRNARVRPPKME